MAGDRRTKTSVQQKFGDEKMRSLEMAISGIEKNFGKGAVMRLGDTQKMNVEVIPTGCLHLDFALGVGGLPRGRIIEVFGPESSGKTTIALHAIAQAQRMGGTAAFIDAEHALDPAYAHKLGIDIENLYVSQPDSGEQAKRCCAPARSISWSSTRWPRSCPGRSWRAIWAIPTWACRPD